MARSPLPLMLALAVAAFLSGCGSWVGEERAHAMGREWREAVNTDWMTTVDERVGVSEFFHTAKSEEAANERTICQHPNSGNRVTQQDGVSDSFSYRHCVLAPYDTEGGQRMGNRPEGVGRVVKTAK